MFFESCCCKIVNAQLPGQTYSRQMQLVSALFHVCRFMHSLIRYIIYVTVYMLDIHWTHAYLNGYVME